MPRGSSSATSGTRKLSPASGNGAWKGAPPRSASDQLGAFGSISAGSEARSTRPR
ncbi:MAG: hypothetical protein QM767_02110 [Anaeromyxobacter sp.]